jgi:hypothetical protein
MCSFYLLLTSAVDGGEWSATRPGRALAPEKGLPLFTGQEAGWASELVWTQRLEKKILSPLPGIEPRSHGRRVRSQTLLTELPRFPQCCLVQISFVWRQNCNLVINRGVQNLSQVVELNRPTHL